MSIVAELTLGCIDPARVDVTTEDDIAVHQATDEIEGMHLQPEQQFELIPMYSVIQLAPKTSITELRGIARGANPEQYRDRTEPPMSPAMPISLTCRM